MRTPSLDAVFRWIKDIESESGYHHRKGSQSYQKTSSHDGLDAVTDLYDLIMRIAIANGLSSHLVNAAIDEQDGPYYSRGNVYLINAPFHRFRGTGRAYRVASLESLKNGERFTLSLIGKDPLDGIDNATSPVDDIGMVLMDRGYIDVGS